MKGALSLWVDVALHSERDRVACQVRIAHLAKQGISCPDTEALLGRVNSHEEWIDTKLAAMIKSHPTYPWFSKVKGCGLENMPKILGLIEGFGTWYDAHDNAIPAYIKGKPVIRELERHGRIVEVEQVFVRGIERLIMPSKLRKYSGLYPGAKRQAGQKLEFNIELRTMFYRLLTSFMMTGGKSGSSYYDFYLKYKDFLRKKKEDEGVKIIPTPKGKYCPICEEEKKVKTARFCPDCNTELIGKKEPEGVLFTGHLDAMTRRRTMQLFSDHLWVVWREAEGLPVTLPYVIEIMGHKGYIDPWSMCDKA